MADDDDGAVFRSNQDQEQSRLDEEPKTVPVESVGTKMIELGPGIHDCIYEQVPVVSMMIFYLPIEFLFAVPSLTRRIELLYLDFRRPCSGTYFVF